MNLRHLVLKLERGGIRSVGWEVEGWLVGGMGFGFLIV
ncbi:hypothetical protein J2T56_003231 [Natronobacillus azotifigens]